jgi:hypothetical protein
VRPEYIGFVLLVAEDEPDGDHWLSHYVMATKVLREQAANASRLANAFKHRRLTREDCDGLVADWREEGWAT